VAGHLIGKQDVVFARAPADVVDDQRGAGLRINLIADNAYMRGAGAQHPGDDIAGQVILRLVGHRDIRAVAFEIGDQVGHAAVVDVAVGTAQPPDFRIGRKMRFHIGVNLGLQVKAVRVPQGADHHICADSALAGDVAVGKFQPLIAAVIDQRHADLGAGRPDQGGGPWGCDL